MSKKVMPAHVFENKWRSDDVRLQVEADFSSLLLSSKVLVGLENAGFKKPSPIQLEAVPVGRFGKDLLVQAKSGTGKTLVFTIIALEALLEVKHPQVLMMAPAREIAIQTRDIVRAVGSAFEDLTCHCFIGGLPIDEDAEKVLGCQIVVGTPGRLSHLINIGVLPTNSIRLLVLDEADVLLEPAFKQDLDFIFQSLPKDKQVIATSATYPDKLKYFVNHYFRNVFMARLNCADLSLLGMIQYIYPLQLHKMPLLAYKVKLAALEKVLVTIDFSQCIVFCNLISRVEPICQEIRKLGFTTAYISSLIVQEDRIKAIDSLKNFRCKVLVTSDVTSRGIDAENVDLIINFDNPRHTKTYFHRCGRAGRYGSKGVAITFITQDEIRKFLGMQTMGNFQAFNLPDPIPSNLICIRPEISDALSIEDFSDKDSFVNLDDDKIIKIRSHDGNKFPNTISTESQDVDHHSSSGGAKKKKELSSKIRNIRKASSSKFDNFSDPDPSIHSPGCMSDDFDWVKERPSSVRGKVVEKQTYEKVDILQQCINDLEICDTRKSLENMRGKRLCKSKSRGAMSQAKFLHSQAKFLHSQKIEQNGTAKYVTNSRGNARHLNFISHHDFPSYLHQSHNNQSYQSNSTAARCALHQEPRRNCLKGISSNRNYSFDDWYDMFYRQWRFIHSFAYAYHS